MKEKYLLLSALFFLLLIPCLRALKVVEQKGEGLTYRIINEPPYFFKDVTITENSVDFKVEKDCSNVTTSGEAKLTLDNYDDVIQDLCRVNVDDVDVTSGCKKLSSKKWERSFSVIPCGKIYHVQMNFLKNQNPLKYRVLFGEGTSVLEVLPIHNFIYITNQWNNWTIHHNKASLKLWEIETGQQIISTNVNEMFGAGENASASWVFAGVISDLECYWNSSKSDSFQTPIMTKIWCNRTTNHLDKVIEREFIFYAYANHTDEITYILDNNLKGINYYSALNMDIPPMTHQCFGDSSNVSAGNFNYENMAETYCGIWGSGSPNDFTLAYVWLRNDTAMNDHINIQDAGPNWWSCMGRNSTHNFMILESILNVRYAITNHSETIPSENFKATQREYSRFTTEPTITNITGGCYVYDMSTGYKAGAGDVLHCLPSSNQLNVSVIPNGNTTRLWFDIKNFTSSDIYVYNYSGVAYDVDLWYHLKNHTGDWYYDNTTDAYFRGCSGNYNGTKVNTGFVCNQTGIWEYQDGNSRLFLTFPVTGNSASLNLQIRDTALPSPPPDLPPNWKNNDTLLPSGTVYSPLQNYGFQVEWYDDIDSVGFDVAYFEHNFTGTTLNYTTTKTGNISYYNYTDLPANDYGIKFYANDSADNWGNTTLWIYNVNKISTTVNLTINGTYANQTFVYGNSSNVTAWEENNNFPTSLARDSLGITNPDITLYGVNSYDFTAFLIHQNYSASNLTRRLTITPLGSDIELYLNGTKANKTHIQEDMINLTANLVFPTTGTVNIYRNDLLWDTGISPLINLTTGWSSGIYKINANWTNINYTTDDETHYLTIICYRETCNSTNIGCYGCSGNDMKYISICANNSGIYEWNASGRTYCTYGCYQGQCQNKTVTEYSICSVNQTRCGGIDNMYRISCQDNDNDGYYEWDWNTSNWELCNYSCFAGECVAHPSGSVFGKCSDGESMCLLNDIVYCRDINNDDVYEWDTNNVTSCSYICEENINDANLRIANCRDEPPLYAYDFQKYASAIGVGFNKAFDNPADKFSFMLFLIIGLGSLVTYKTSWDLGFISVVGIILLGTVIGWIPIYMTLIMVVIGGLLWYNNFRGEKNED